MVTHWEAYNLYSKANAMFHIHRNSKNKMSLNAPSATDRILWNGPKMFVLTSIITVCYRIFRTITRTADKLHPRVFITTRVKSKQITHTAV